jgi:putative FmdB family regulatory protein
MPIYEYKCIDCGAHVEKMQKISDAPLTVCESCGGKLEKQLSLSGFQFKGAGWYVTDYSGKGKGAESSEKSEKSEKSSAPESTAKTDGASNKTNDAASSTKKETVSKKE